MPLARSQVIVKVASSSNFGSPPATFDCPGSQNLASPLIASPFKARKASAPPSAAIACLTRLLAPFCANDGCTWLMAKSSAAEIDKAYFIVGPSLNLWSLTLLLVPSCLQCVGMSPVRSQPNRLGFLNNELKRILKSSQSLMVMPTSMLLRCLVSCFGRMQIPRHVQPEGLETLQSGIEVPQES